MKVTFPHMGNVFITAKALLDALDIDYIIPPANNKEALALGARLAPESACLPLKITTGNLLQVLQKETEVDTILMAGGNGPCRFGYYSEMQREILQDAGFTCNMITLEAPYGNVKELYKRIKHLCGTIQPITLSRALYQAAKIALAVDEIEQKTFYTRPRECFRGQTDHIYNQFLQKARNTTGPKALMALISNTKQQLNQIPCDLNRKILKIGIVGEIYTTIDDFSNYNINRTLGYMGIEVSRAVTISDWIIEHMLKKALHLPRKLDFAVAARSYLKTMIGGHAQETIGNSVLYALNNYDGLIQLYSLTCMPEIVAQSILPTIQRHYQIPILTLIIDEMTGEPGYITRLEAFVDLINQKRKEQDPRALYKQLSRH